VAGYIGTVAVEADILGFFVFIDGAAGSQIYPTQDQAQAAARLHVETTGDACGCQSATMAVLSVAELGIEWEAGCCLQCGVITGPHIPDDHVLHEDWDIWPLTSMGSAQPDTEYMQWSPGPLGPAPTVVSLGLGTDSVAMLIGLKQRGIRPDLILFSDPGNERPETYAYLLPFSRWLERVGFPPITVVRYRARRFKFQPYHSLAGNMLANRTLPSIAFFRKGCSVKAKGDVLDGHVTRVFGNVPCYRLIGYDASSKDTKRACRAAKTGQGTSGSRTRPQDVFLYPLQLWGWDREKCHQVILDEGLPDPGKSACTFCSALKPDEVRQLSKPHLRLIVLLEANAAPNLRIIRGLWHSERIADFIRQEGLLPAWEVDLIWSKWSAPDRVIPQGSDILAEDVIVRQCGFDSVANLSPFLPILSVKGEQLSVADSLHHFPQSEMVRNVVAELS
jgi:hypothetical protein